MKIRELLKSGCDILKLNNIDEANLKAKLLLSYLLNTNKEYLMIHDEEDVDEKIIQCFEDKIEEIKLGKPVQYITHNQDFMGLKFFVDEGVLIPQPDTEILVQEVIQKANQESSKKILDICTGSGAIAISIKKICNFVEVIASDISEKALEIAQKNAKLNEVDIKFQKSDMFENINEKFDIIVSNPPYIENEIIEALPKEVQNEPYIALAGGKDGLDFYRIIAQNAKKHLTQNGIVAVEIGYNQKESVIKLFEEEGYKEIYSKKDFGQNDRIVVAKF
jgi:release factor glutamine methyltransferase